MTLLGVLSFMPGGSGYGQTASPVSSGTGIEPKWNVRVEVLMVAMPQDKAIAMLPDLRDDGKIGGAVSQLLEAVQRKEALLVGYPMVSVTDGKRSATDAVSEKRFPTEFDPPQEPKDAAPSFEMTKNPNPGVENSDPTAFETRNTGVTLEAAPKVDASGKWIHLELVSRQVEWGGMDYFYGWTTSDGRTTQMYQPKFNTSKLDTAVVTRGGQWSLIGMHKVTKPENYLEVMVMMATATPVD